MVENRKRQAVVVVVEHRKRQEVEAPVEHRKRQVVVVLMEYRKRQAVAVPEVVERGKVNPEKIVVVFLAEVKYYLHQSRR